MHVTVLYFNCIALPLFVVASPPIVTGPSQHSESSSVQNCLLHVTLYIGPSKCTIIQFNLSEVHAFSEEV